MLSSLCPPVLIVAFKRPNSLRSLLSQLRECWSGRLYIAVDGVRDDRPQDIEMQREVVEVANSVDWVHDKRVRVSGFNLGCRLGPATAISWFFSQEEGGVILEEDCLPGTDFIKFCGWALAKFKTDRRVWHISGNNFSAPAEYFGQSSCAFVPLAQVWGWATWADRWGQFVGNPFWVDYYSRRRIEQWPLSRIAKLNKLRHIGELKRGLDTWDYQWQCAVLNGGGFAVVPSSNQITNIGDGPDATHTKRDSRIGLETHPIQASFESFQLLLNRPVTDWFEQQMGLRARSHALGYQVSRAIVGLRRSARALVAAVLFCGCPTVVVASTGRSGSTLLADTLAAGIVLQRYWFLPKTIRSFLVKFVQILEPRLGEARLGQFPVTKTHDYYENVRSLDCSFVFVFGDPLESALSVKKMEEEQGRLWVDEHLFNLGSEGDPNDVFQKDVLCFERQLRSWSGDPENILMIHYEDLWDFSECIEKFCGVKVLLPPRRGRSDKKFPASFNSELFENLRALANQLRVQSQERMQAWRTGRR